MTGRALIARLGRLEADARPEMGDELKRWLGILPGGVTASPDSASDYAVPDMRGWSREAVEWLSTARGHHERH